MINKSVEFLSERLGKECMAYLVELPEKTKGEIIESSRKIAFVLELKNFVANGDNMLCLSGCEAVTNHIDDITVEEIYQYYNDSDDNHFDTRSSLSELLIDFCTYLVF